jgi:hypothetical protein
MRSGLRFVIDKGVDPEVRRACKEFGAWLRKEYFFPIRIPVYVKANERIKAKDGDMVTGTFFEPYNRGHEPYIRIAAGDYKDLLLELGKDSALAAILSSIVHELTHYFQWINDIKLTEIGIERQASAYSSFLLDEYAETREHP